MKESARAAWTYARSHAAALQVPDEMFDRDIHIHVPAGAIPKDGPSAGVTMASAIVSAMSGRPVAHDIAMTGEITLRGRVLPIGGVKEKVLGAVRAGINRVILPKDNEADLEDLPKEVRDKLDVHLVGELGEVLALTLRGRDVPRGAPALRRREEPAGRGPALGGVQALADGYEFSSYELRVGSDARLASEPFRCGRLVIVTRNSSFVTNHNAPRPRRMILDQDCARHLPDEPQDHHVSPGTERHEPPERRNGALTGQRSSDRGQRAQQEARCGGSDPIGGCGQGDGALRMWRKGLPAHAESDDAEGTPCGHRPGKTVDELVDHGAQDQGNDPHPGAREKRVDRGPDAASPVHGAEQADQPGDGEDGHDQRGSGCEAHRDRVIPTRTCVRRPA